MTHLKTILLLILIYPYYTFSQVEPFQKDSLNLIELEKVIQKAYNQTLNTNRDTVQNDTIRNFYEIYEAVMTANKSFSWSLESIMASNNFKNKYFIIFDKINLKFGDFIINQDEDKIENIRESIKIQGRTYCPKRYKRSRTFKLKKLRRFSEYMYYTNKFNYKTRLLKSPKTFYPSIKNSAIKFVHLTPELKQALNNYIGERCYWPGLINPCSLDDTLKEKQNALFERAIIGYPIIESIQLDSKFQYAIVQYFSEYRSCSTNTKRSPIYLQKINSKWTIIYPTEKEAYVRYQVYCKP